MKEFPMVNGLLLSTYDLKICTNEGEPIGATLHAMTYNASIGAVELRAYRSQTERAIPDLTDKGPLHVFAMGGRVFLIHYEAVTFVPIEFDTGEQIVTVFESAAAGETRRVHDCAVRELHVLRGARIESFV